MYGSHLMTCALLYDLSWTIVGGVYVCCEIFLSSAESLVLNCGTSKSIASKKYATLPCVKIPLATTHFQEQARMHPADKDKMQSGQSGLCGGLLNLRL